MNELDFNYTLFVSEEDRNNLPYEIQISTEFFDGYTPGSFSVKNTPTDANGTLELQLNLIPGDDNVIIHDFSLDILPSSIQNPQWVIDVEYVYDHSGEELRKRKKKNTEQAKIDSKPRPYKQQTV